MTPSQARYQLRHTRINLLSNTLLCNAAKTIIAQRPAKSKKNFFPAADNFRGQIIKKSFRYIDGRKCRQNNRFCHYERYAAPEIGCFQRFGSEIFRTTVGFKADRKIGAAPALKQKRQDFAKTHLQLKLQVRFCDKRFRLYLSKNRFLRPAGHFKRLPPVLPAPRLRYIGGSPRRNASKARPRC